MELRHPPGKLDKLACILNKHKDVKFISKKSLEILTGLLAHCATIVKGGRVFCRRLYDLYKLMCNKQLKRVCVSVAARDDILWWFHFSHIFNGKNAIRNVYYIHSLVSDESMQGFVAFLGEDWIAGVWPHVETILTDSSCAHVATPPVDPSVDYTNINVLELWPIVMGIKRLFTLLQHSTLCIYTDNTQVKCMLTKGVSSNKTCMAWLRELYWMCVIYDIQLEAHYVSTTDNELADALSRIACDRNDSYLSIIKDSHLCCANNIDFFVNRYPESSSDHPHSSLELCENDD